MYSAGRNARLDEGESELFDNLNLVGISGRFCGILTERQLTFEDYSGYGIRVNLSNISTLRNINVARLPNSFLTIGAVGVWVGATIITPPLGLAIAATGGLSMLGYFTMKTPVLSIETNAGDKHLVTGTQSELLRLCMMVDRVMHGCSIEEAKAGLRELEVEREKILAENQPKALIAAPQNMENFEPSSYQSEPITAPIGHQEMTVTTPLNSAPSVSQFGDTVAQEGGIFASLEAIGPAITPSFESTQPSNSMDTPSAYERAWGRQESPDWYREKESGNSQEDRIGEAVSDALESFDMFGEGGMFDIDSPTTTAISTVYSEPESTLDFNEINRGQYTNQTELAGTHASTTYSPPTISTPNRPLSSSEMIRSAQSKHGNSQPFSNASRSLPTPTESAVREECKPGLVKTAKARSAWQSENEKRILSAPTTEPENFGEEFPAVSKLANSMTSGRVRSSVGSPKKQNWLASLLSPTQPRKEYADVYGDEDGRSQGEVNRFRTSQLLRLRSDQDHQADVVSRAKEGMTTAGPSSARDALDNVVSRVASGEEREATSKSRSEGLRFSQLRPTTQKGDGRLPGIRQLK